MGLFTRKTEEVQEVVPKPDTLITTGWDADCPADVSVSRRVFDNEMKSVHRNFSHLNDVIANQQTVINLLLAELGYEVQDVPAHKELVKAKVVRR